MDNKKLTPVKVEQILEELKNIKIDIQEIKESLASTITPPSNLLERIESDTIKKTKN